MRMLRTLARLLETAGSTLVPQAIFVRPMRFTGTVEPGASPSLLIGSLICSNLLLLERTSPWGVFLRVVRRSCPSGLDHSSHLRQTSASTCERSLWPQRAIGA